MPERGPVHGDETRLIVLIGALSAFAPLSIDMYLPALPRLATSLGGAAWQLQLTITGCLIGLAVGQLVAGPLSDRFGRRRPLLLGVALYAAASLGCAAAPSVPVLVLLRLLQGGSGAAGIVVARAVARDLYAGPALARFLALMMVVNGLAPVLAPVIGAQILRLGSWRPVFVLLALIGTTLLAAAAAGLPETLPPRRRRRDGPGRMLATLRALVSDRTFAGCALANGLAYAAMFAYIAGSPFVVQDRFGRSAQFFSLIFATNACGIMAAGQLSARLARRCGARPLLRTGLAMSLSGAVVLAVAGATGAGLPVILPGFFLVVASIGFISPNAAAIALGRHGSDAGSASALLGLAQFLIGGAAASLAGLGGARADAPMIATIGAASLGASLCFVLLAGREAVRPPAAASPAADAPPS